MSGVPDLSRPARVHFVGIGGVGMAGLARLLVQRGFTVSGSDGTPNRLTRELVEMGVTFYEGHRVAHVDDSVNWAVRTPAVREDNPEVVGLRNLGIPVFRRGDVLAAYSRTRHTIAVAGAHGKTTTSAMLAWILYQNGHPCGYAIGGETELPGTVADAGAEDLFVCEADESDGTLVQYAPDTILLTHLEWDHPERFPTEESLWSCYRACIAKSGTVWIREDDEMAVQLTSEHADCKTVGVSDAADIRLLSQEDDAEGQTLHIQAGGEPAKGRISLPGLHNTWNGLMALGAALEHGVSLQEGLRALEGFPSVGRRFQQEEVNGVRIIQDYAHHPTEIRAVLTAAKALKPNRILVVFQPHRYSRTRRLLHGFAESFSGADRLDLLPVYAAFELPAQGAESDELATACSERFPDLPVQFWKERGELVDTLSGLAQEGDLVLILGAGDAGGMQQELVKSFGVE